MFLVRNNLRGRHVLNVIYGEVVRPTHPLADQQAVAKALHIWRRKEYFNQLVLYLSGEQVGSTIFTWMMWGCSWGRRACFCQLVLYLSVKQVGFLWMM